VLGTDLGNRGQFLSRKDLPRRVVWGVDDDDLGLVRESGTAYRVLISASPYRDLPISTDRLSLTQTPLNPTSNPPQSS
jgi:hypothetical protein